MNSRHVSPDAQSGFTLVEALVALIVLSIGLLGVAALQLSSLRANTSAAYRSQATFLAYDIADRMRANRTGALKDEYVLAFDDDAPSATDTVAERDLAAWRTRVTSGTVLPADANGEIAWADKPNGVVAIRIQWTDTHGDTQAAQATAGQETGLITFEMRTRI
jgi:type IV pilus assembly protein PilV